MDKRLHLAYSRCTRTPPALNKLRIHLIIFFCSFLWVYSVQGQHLLKEFKPKVKSAAHTARHIVQDDGKIVMLGDYAFLGEAPVSNLLRFELDGSLDKGFILSDELRDQFTTDFGQCCSRANVVQGPGDDLVLSQSGFKRRVTIVDKSGKFKADIVLPAGYFQFERLIKHKGGYIAIVHKFGSMESIFRLDQNGRVDSAFARIDFDGYVDDIMVDPNNNIFIAGDLTISGTRSNLIKINELGLLDNTFNTVSIGNSFAEIDLFPDGRIAMSSGNTIVLLDANGNTISSFSPETDGKQIFSSVIDQVNNRIIVLIEQYPQPVAVKALELDGSISDLFTPISIGIGSANALARILRFNQKFVLSIGDEIKYGTSFHSFLVFDGTGSVDTNISSKEKLFNVGRVNAAIELDDGNLIIGGSFSHVGNTQVNNLAKLDKSGNVNSVFVGNNPLSISDEVKEIKISLDKQVYVGGFFRDILGSAVSSLIRVNTNGQLDAAFVTHVASTASSVFLDDFIIMSDRIIACGSYGGNVVAFDFNGNPVPSFNTNIFGSQWVTVTSLCKIDEDNFAMGGHVPNEKGFLWIMDMNGNIDNSFVRQDQIPISSDHMVKAGNELYRAGYILGGQSSLDANFIFKYNLETGLIKSTNLGTYTLSKNRHVLLLNDSTVVISGKFDHLNKTIANNFVVSDYEGVNYKRLTFQVSPGIAGHQVLKTVRLSDEKILLIGQFDKINNEPFYSSAIVNYTNFKPEVHVKATYSIPEDTSFYLSNLIDIVDLDDQVHFSAKQNDNLTVGGNGLLTLKQNFAGSIELEFNVGDALVVTGPFKTTLNVQPINDAPVIKGQLEVPHVLAGEKYEIGLGVLDVIDVDGDNLTLKVQGGENYNLASGTSILSNANFSGTLKVGVSVSDGTLTSGAFMMSIESSNPTGVDEVSDLVFYPNPFSDYIRINSWDSIEHLSIHTITGQKLLEYDHADLEQTSGIFHTGTLPEGILLLNVVLKTNKLLHIKIIKK